MVNQSAVIITIKIGMLVGYTAGIDRQVCLLVFELGQVGRCVG